VYRRICSYYTGYTPHEARKKSKELLDQAKREVEEMIEKESEMSVHHKEKVIL